MTTDSNLLRPDALPGSAELRQKILAALAALSKFAEGQSWVETGLSRIAREITYQMVGASISSVLRDELMERFRASAEFKSLNEYVMGDSVYLNIFLGVDPVKDKLNSTQLTLIAMYVEAMLARALLLIKYRDSTEPKVKLVDQFVAFLSPGRVRRKISIPINHLATNQPELDLGRCGKLYSTYTPVSGESPLREIVELARHPACQLVFEAETGKFNTAMATRISDELRLRIALIRLVVQPLASFNHFSVSHVDPWEEPMDDTDFFERFWAGSSEGAKQVARVSISPDAALQIGALFEACDGFDWRADTPWRLAVNRLDDAVYKLECGSTDSLLDVVIGLESVMVEADSTQESTHKVASRTARFLEDNLESRQATFKRVKQLYGLRSRIAHGKAISLDKSELAALADGAAILCRILRKMLERRQSQLDHQLLDLL